MELFICTTSKAAEEYRLFILIMFKASKILLIFKPKNFIKTRTNPKALKNHLNPGMQKKCAKWLLAHLDELEMNYIDRKYYGILFQYLVSPLDAIFQSDVEVFKQEIY